MGIILASASPRRRELLRQVGAKFVVKVSQVVEDNQQKLPPQELVMLQARQKAEAVARDWFDKPDFAKDDIVVGADTIVVKDDRVFGKPQNREEAFQMLTALSGTDHQVISGLAVAYYAESEYRLITDFSATTVSFRTLTPTMIHSYLATGESADKAGAYAIQGRAALFITKIIGDYTNVVGLPLAKLAILLEKIGVALI